MCCVTAVYVQVTAVLLLIQLTNGVDASASVPVSAVASAQAAAAEAVSPPPVASTATADPHHSGRPAGVGPQLDCGLRKLAHSFSVAVAGRRTADDRKTVFDALQLSSLCGEPPLPPVPPPQRPPPPPSAFPPSTTVFVDAAAGSDTAGTGARASPVRSLREGVHRSRQLRRSSFERVTVALQPGTYYLSAPLVLAPQDSNLSITSVGPGPAVISGGLLLNTSNWTAHNVTRGANIWAVSLKGQLAAGHGIDGLRLGGRRVTRARYPNSDPEFDTFPTGWITSKGTTWDLSPSSGNTLCKGCAFVTTSTPSANGTGRGVYTNHMEGSGGPCEIFASKQSYWCGEHPSSACPQTPEGCATCNGSNDLPATGQPAAFYGTPPVGMSFAAAQLPNAPYLSGAPGAVVQAWRPGHWFNYMWEVADYAAPRGRFEFGRGGYQGGQQGVNGAGEWFIENVVEEVDAPNEFYFEPVAQQLLLSYNGTGAPAAAVPLVAPMLKTLVRVDGTRLQPVSGLSFSGLTFTDTAPTFLDDTWDTPSGGDWALNFGAALHVEGSERLHVDRCTFSRLDGNAVLLGGANRGAQITENEFVLLGQNAIVLWGRSDGVDATAGDFPRGTNISHNLCHEIGHYEKQSSCVFQVSDELRKKGLDGVPLCTLTVSVPTAPGEECRDEHLAQCILQCPACLDQHQ